MKQGLKRTSGFTLIELLVVIAIIGILAGILLPVLGRVKVAGQKSKATTEINNLVGAINQYQATYARYPTTKGTRTLGIDTGEHPDFTYGTFMAGVDPAQPNAHVTKQQKSTSILNPKPGGMNTNNSEVMAILMNVKEWVNKQPGNPENPQGQDFFSPKSVDQKTSAGLGPDGVLRDPWGAPYIITLDMNYDNQARDAFYRNQAVTRPDTTKPPANGLFLVVGSSPPAYEARTGVMVWSLGPDGQADETVAAGVGVNKDNILSWK